MKKDFKNRIKEWGTPVLAIGLLYLFFYIVGIGCPIKFLTGISCRGCGMTRAWICALRLDFAGAFYYHPLFLTVPVGAVLIIFRSRLTEKTFKKILIIIVGLFLIVYTVRVFFSDGSIVSVHPRESILFKLVNLFRRK